MTTSPTLHSLASIKAVVFDMDDTLYLEESFILSGFQAVSDFLQTEGIVVNGLYKTLKSIYESGSRGRIFNEAFEQVGATASDALVKELLMVYREHQPTISLLPDAENALNYFGERYPLGLITDGYANVQRHKIAALGIRDRFDAVVISDDYGREHWKPSPMPYELIADALNIDPRHLVYIGDNPKKDFVMAKQLGWQTVQIVRPHGQYVQFQPDEAHAAQFTVSNLDALRTLPLFSPRLATY